jgi:LEA14-like dessication related protein
MNKKNWWLLPATIIGYLVYKKYVLAKSISVFFKSIDFSSMSLLYPTINIVVQINNPTDVTATIQNIKGDLYLNKTYVGNVIGITPTTLETGSSTLRIPVTLSYTGVASIIKGFNFGDLKLKFKGTLLVDYIELPLEFEYNI